MKGLHFTYKFSLLKFMILFTLSKGKPYYELDYGPQLSSIEDDRLRNIPQALMLYDEDSDSLSSAPIGYAAIDKPRIRHLKNDPNLKDELTNTDDTDEGTTGNEAYDFNPLNINDDEDKQDIDTENSRDNTNNLNNDYNKDDYDDSLAQDSADINDNTDNDNGLNDDATNEEKGTSFESNVDSVNSEDGGLKKVSCSTSKAITLNQELLQEIALSSSDEASSDEETTYTFPATEDYPTEDYPYASENNNISDDSSDSVTTKDNMKIITDDDGIIIETTTEPYTVVYKSPGLPQKLRGPDHFIDDI